jgi:hypothetical protein
MPEQTLLSAAATAPGEFELRKLPPRHTGKCRVCRHHDRVGIELRFLEWSKPGHIAREHGIKNRASIYRHAHAAHLFERRRRTAVCTYKTTLKQFELGLATSDAVRIAADRIEVAIRHHLAGPTFAHQDWIPAVFRANRLFGPAGVAAHLPSPGIPEPKSQQRQQESRTSLILRAMKFLNTGKTAFHVSTKSLFAGLATKNRRPRDAVSVPSGQQISSRRFYLR